MAFLTIVFSLMYPSRTRGALSIFRTDEAVLKFGTPEARAPIRCPPLSIPVA
jgi:hypothetical protein